LNGPAKALQGFLVLSKTLAIRGCGAWLIAAAIVIAGCAPQQSAAPPTSAVAVERPPVDLIQIKSELLEAQSQLGKTNDALNALAKPPRQDLSQKYDAFSTQYYKLQTKLNLARSHAYDLKSQAKAYPAGAGASDADRLGSTANEQMDATRFAFNRYTSTLEQIRGLLASDRSAAGVESVAGLIARSNAEAQNLDGHITALTKAIDELSAAKDRPNSPATSPAALAK
jgi:hypothetical protein